MHDRHPNSNPGLFEEEFSIKRAEGSLPVYCAAPDDNKAHPCLILIHEIFGVNEHIRDVARRFVREGYAVFAPDLFAYHPQLPYDRNDLAAMRAVWSSIPDEQLISDLQAVFEQARRSSRVNKKAIGALGYCMGGAIAYLFAARTPLLAYAIDYYGRIYYQDITTEKPRHPISYTGGLNCPFLGLFSGIDDLIPLVHIQELEKKQLDLGKKTHIKVYPNAKHAFFNDTREFYHREAATDAWQLTLAFMEANSQKS